jgi:hypothetical protein
MWFQQIATGPITSTTTPSGTSIGVVSNATPALSEATPTTATSGGVTVTTTGPLSTIESISIAAPVILRPSSALSTGGGGAGGLYRFTNATFTPGGQTGRFGPALATARVGLTGTGTDDWKNNTSFFNVSDGIQLWTVPATGNYRIEAFGAQGGSNLAYGESPGRGARMRGDFALTQGEIIRILVGQAGPTTNTTCGSAGGGGGTYVVRTPFNTNGSILVIAGGGGGVGTTGGVRAGRGGTTSQTGTNSTGDNVSGGSGGAGGAQPPGTPCSTGYVSGSGAGFFTNGGGPGGGPGGGDTGGGFAFVNGGRGGDLNIGGVGGNTDGGFGGGGKGHYGAGAGGGYSGGGGGQGTSCDCTTWRGGGGGGSFNSGNNQSNSDDVRSGDGQVIITLI